MIRRMWVRGSLLLTGVQLSSFLALQWLAVSRLLRRWLLSTRVVVVGFVGECRGWTSRLTMTLRWMRWMSLPVPVIVGLLDRVMPWWWVVRPPCRLGSTPPAWGRE